VECLQLSNRIKEEFLQKSEPVRLNKYLSEAGVCSRREADRLIETGRVTVDGQRAQTGMRIVPGQVVKIGNKVVSKQDEMIVLAVNKPRGIVCTEERRERDSIVRFLNYPVRVTYIGRLDKDSHGLLLMTNNGDIINKMMRAANKHEKEYKVTVDKEITEDFLKKMAAGVPILDTVTRPCTVKKIGKYTFSIILTQGLNRQIRRMCEALGYEVKDLLRVRVMNITLDGLKDGQYRKLTDQELNELYDQLKDSSVLPGGKYQEQWAAAQDNRTRHGKGKKR
jgi:23S rRNA pseudouridine2604 synthase